MSMRFAALLGSVALGFVSSGVRAEDIPSGQTDVRIELPAPSSVLIVDHDKQIDAALRGLPSAESAPVAILPGDSVAAVAVAAPELKLRGPLADRLFPDLPRTDHAAAAVATPPGETPPGEMASAFSPDDKSAAVGQPAAEAAPSPVQEAIAKLLLAAKPDKKLGLSEVRQLAQYYAARQNKPIWHEDAKRGAKAEELLATLRTSEADGLDIAAYAAPAPVDDTPEAVAAADIALSRAVTAYARDARGARIMNPSRISLLIDAKPDIPAVAVILSALESASDPGVVLQDFNPPQAQYKALKAALAEMRSGINVQSDLVSVGKTLRLGENDERVAQLRRRLGVPAAEDETLFDEPLADAVKEFQRGQGIRATGILNQITTAALNGEPIAGAVAGALSQADLISNMERWRWMPRDLGYNHIFVNIPEFKLWIIKDSLVTHETRVVVGKPETQTPIFSDEVEFVIVNPTWTVPPSIALKEYLPKLRDNPYALQNKGFEIVRNGRVVDPGTVDWWSGNPANVSIRQPPGERNALGHIKFMFPNSHAVYLHDTPQKKFFAEDSRAYSHGCVRVEDPFALAEVVLGGRDGGWPQERVERLIGGQRERTITLSRHMPVHLAYFTVTTDADGKPVKARDVYGHDSRVKRALGL